MPESQNVDIYSYLLVVLTDQVRYERFLSHRNGSAQVLLDTLQTVSGHRNSLHASLKHFITALGSSPAQGSPTIGSIRRHRSPHQEIREVPPTFQLAGYSSRGGIGRGGKLWRSIQRLLPGFGCLYQSGSCAPKNIERSESPPLQGIHAFLNLVLPSPH